MYVPNHFYYENKSMFSWKYSGKKKKKLKLNKEMKICQNNR